MDTKRFCYCPKCGHLAVVDASIILTSYPPQYSYYCEHCNETGFVFCSDTEPRDIDVIHEW